MKKIVLISCVTQKQPFPAIAEELYTSTLFKLNLSYAKSLSPDKIFILSAKHGLIDLESTITPYNVTLNSMKTSEIKQWSHKTLSRLKAVSDLKRDHFVFLAGEKYRRFLLPHINSYEIPLEGLRIGQQLSWLKKAMGS